MKRPKDTYTCMHAHHTRMWMDTFGTILFLHEIIVVVYDCQQIGRVHNDCDNVFFLGVMDWSCFNCCCCCCCWWWIFFDCLKYKNATNPESYTRSCWPLVMAAVVWAIFVFFIETRIALHYFVTFLSLFCLFNLSPCGKLNQTWKTKLSKREANKSERNKSIRKIIQVHGGRWKKLISSTHDMPMDAR